MMTVGILGATGPAGRALAARLASVGIDVYAGSREPARAEATVRELRDRWGDRVGTIEPVGNAEAAETAEIVLIATNAQAPVATAAEHSGALAGTPTVSMANPVERVGAAGKVGSSFRPVVTEQGSIARAIQCAVPDARVAAALHHVPAAALGNLERPVLSDVVVVSDDLEAMRATQALVAAMPDLRPLDGGGLDNALGLESFCAVLLTVNLRTRESGYGASATLRLIPT